MKPDWKDAPEWMNWRTQDQNGTWWWSEEKPFVDHLIGKWNVESGRFVRVEASEPKWESTLGSKLEEDDDEYTARRNAESEGSTGDGDNS